MSQPEGSYDPPQRRGYSQTKRIVDSTGKREESFIYDPYGARMNHQGENPALDAINETYGGFETKALWLGHLKEKDREVFIAAGVASASLMNLAFKQPSLKGLSDMFFESYVHIPAIMDMGVNGNAINSENTEKRHQITEERKKGRFGLR